MERLAQKQYIFDVSKDKLKKLGFRYSKKYEGYMQTFEVYKYKNLVPMIYCRITVDEESKRVWLNICDDQDRLYAPYYNEEYGKNNIIKNIEKEVETKLNQFGIERVV